MEKLELNKEYDIPHESPHFHLKLGILLAFVFVSLVFMSFYVVSTVNENRILKNSISEIRIASEKQAEMLRDNASEIKLLKYKENAYNTTVNEYNTIINEYAEKYREIAEKYVLNLTSRSSSRSSDRNTASFSSDYAELKDILKSLSEISEPDNSLFDLSETESMLQDHLNYIPTQWPVTGKISAKFGYRKDPFTKKKAFHDGLDISASTGTNIKASGSGTVIFSGKKNGYGNVIIIEHGSGIKTLYAHASKLIAKKGQKIEKGEVIAKVGSTGRSTGPHLHYEMLLADVPVDPYKYLD